MIVIKSPPTKKQQPATALDQDLRINRLPELDALANHELKRPRNKRQVHIILQHLKNTLTRNIAADTKKLGHRIRIKRHVKLKALLLLAATTTAITISVAVTI